MLDANAECTAWTAAESPEALQVTIKFFICLSAALFYCPGCYCALPYFNISDKSTLASSFLSEKLDIPPSRMRMVKLFAVLSGALHLSACLFWRVKVLVLAIYAQCKPQSAV